MDGGKEKRRGALGGRDRRKGVDSSMGDWSVFLLNELFSFAKLISSPHSGSISLDLNTVWYRPISSGIPPLRPVDVRSMTLCRCSRDRSQTFALQSVSFFCCRWPLGPWF